MPKVVTPLNERKIINAKPKESNYTLTDGNGLQLLIKSSGVKIWEFVFTSPITKKRRKKTFGSYPIITLAKARTLKNEYLTLISNGIDPVEQIKEIEKDKIQNDKSLFQNVMNEWFERQKEQLVDVTYKTKYRIFTTSVLPYLRNKHMQDITKLDLLHILEEKEKTAKETASRLYNYLSNLWAYAVLKDYCEYNYLANINKNDILLKKRITKNYPKITEEPILKELVNSIYNYNGSHSIRNALKFVLHIPLRAYNLCSLKWEYINFKNKTLVIPRNLMKVKNHNLNDFQLPLTDEVINILLEQKEFLTLYTELREYIFIGTDNINPINRESPNQALMRMGFTANKKQSLHSFRGTFRTIVEEKQPEHQVSEKIMESILDHNKDSKVELAYKNKVNYFEQQKPLLNWWSNYILSLKD